jgi:hypothetical protein
MVRPNDSKPHPLALMAHGTPREAKDRAGMTPLENCRKFAPKTAPCTVVMIDDARPS